MKLDIANRLSSMILSVCFAVALCGCRVEQGARPASVPEQQSQADARIEQPRQRSLWVHDPSTIVKCKGEYWVFATGRGVASRRSKDLIDWQAGPSVFASAPAWTSEAAPGNRGYFWAPDVIHLNGRYLLYYSVSRWGSKHSAIGLASNPTLDPADANYRWIDEGIVIQSGDGDDFNAIDPAVVQDLDGGLWLAFGSFWSGIKLIRLDPATGERISPDSPIYSLAYHETIEAPCIYHHKGWYYLFVNWGLCCRGVNSTYNIRVGRSADITGPYIDKDGVNMLAGGGSLFLETQGDFIGPGHAGIFSQGDKHWLSYHYYDGSPALRSSASLRRTSRAGRAALAIRPLQWNADGWPELGEPLNPPNNKD